MDDVQLYIYIALAVIYFIARALKPSKRKKPPLRSTGTDADQQKTPDNPEKDRPLTFEELLQEFTGEKATSTASRQKEVVEETGGLDEVDDEYKPYDIYDDYKESEYVQYQQSYGINKDLKTIDEQVSIEDPIEKAFESYEIRKAASLRAKKFREILLNQNSLKDAIILKELLEPKYF